VTPIVLAVGIAGMGLFQQSTSAAERSEQSRQLAIAERVVTAGEVGLSPRILDELNGADGVETAVGLQHTEVFHGPDLDPSPAAGLTAGDVREVLDLDVQSGSLRQLNTGTVAISENMADQTNARLGNTLTFRLGDGHEASAQVIAVFSRSVGFADVVLPQELVAEHVTDAGLDAVFISGRTTANSEQALQKIVARHPGAEAGGPELVKRDDDASAKSQAWVGYLLMALVASFAAIAVVNSLALSTAERVREFALMRLGGTTRRQILRMLRWETLTVIVLGSTLGAAVAVASLIPYSSRTTDSPRPSTPALMCLGLLGGVVLMALIGTQVPGRLALRARPVESIGTKQ
jgi:putative ABC transport system permease protein